MAAGLIEDGFLNGTGVEDLARRLGVTDRHLRRVFQAEFGVSPVRLAQTQRLLLAKRLLTDTRLPVIEVAMASGFASLRRFNALFKSRYRLTPSELRKSTDNDERPDKFIFKLGYRPPLAWDNLISFFGQRAVEGMEEVEGRTYRRSVRLTRQHKDYSGWIEVLPSLRGHVVEVRVDPALLKVIPSVLGRVKRLFDLSCHPEEIAVTLGDLAADRPGLRVPGAFDGFELAVRAILGQHISVKAARVMAGRFIAAFGRPIHTPFPSIRLVFPEPRRISELSVSDMAGIGITSQRARSILSLARSLVRGSLNLDYGADVGTTMKTLVELPGIGDWTAQYIAMRALAWPDAFPAADYGVLKAMNETKPARAVQTAEKWRPWRAYAVMHLWASLEGKKK
jgi:AraC family transcriptional regulator of adaptative response / DNA-3-methyladenine glycosylase II